MISIAMLGGAVCGLGVYVVRSAFQSRSLSNPRTLLAASAWGKPMCIGLGSAVLTYVLSGWFLVSISVALAAALVVGSSRQRHSSRANEEVAEAIALWTEQLRDTLAAAHGLQQTLLATSQHAPGRIAPQVQRLAAKLPYAPVAQSLRDFASEVDHSSADFVAAALIAATEHEARDVGSLLGHLARCSRDEARMHQRIWVGRSRTRSAVRIISVTVTGFVGLLFAFNRDYLEPYGSPNGQVVLMAIVGLFAAALVMLQISSKVQVPERFVAVGK